MHDGYWRVDEDEVRKEVTKSRVRVGRRIQRRNGIPEHSNIMVVASCMSTTASPPSQKNHQDRSLSGALVENRHLLSALYTGFGFTSTPPSSSLASLDREVDRVSTSE